LSKSTCVGLARVCHILAKFRFLNGWLSVRFVNIAIRINMKKLRILIVFLPLLCSTCKKEEVDPVWYTDVAPDQSVTSMIPFPFTIDDVKKNNIGYMMGEGYNSRIVSGMASVNVDLNNDAKLDFQFQVIHSLLNEGAGRIYDEYIHIGSFDDYEISLSDQANGNIKRYDFNEEIDDSSFGNVPFSGKHTVAYLVRKNAEHNLNNLGEFYLAIKVKSDNKSYYGWMLVETKMDPLSLTVKEYALSKVADKKIRVGQRE